MLPYAFDEGVSGAEVLAVGIGEAIQRREVDSFPGRQVLLRTFHDLVASRRPIPEMAEVWRIGAGVGRVADRPGAVVEHPGPSGEGRKLRQKQDEEAEIAQSLKDSRTDHSDGENLVSRNL